MMDVGKNYRGQNRGVWMKKKKIKLGCRWGNN
jgi:hypothetical protein